MGLADCDDDDHAPEPWKPGRNDDDTKSYSKNPVNSCGGESAPGSDRGELLVTDIDGEKVADRENVCSARLNGEHEDDDDVES